MTPGFQRVTGAYFAWGTAPIANLGAKKSGPPLHNLTNLHLNKPLKNKIVVQFSNSKTDNQSAILL